MTTTTGWVPQALADERTRCVLHVFPDQDIFERFWADKVKTVPAPGVPVHPLHVVPGDIVDLSPVGWNRVAVQSMAFAPDDRDDPLVMRSGTVTLNTKKGDINIRVAGHSPAGPQLYRFSL